MITVDGLTKTFRMGKDDVLAVDGVSFECRSGEAFGIIGPNGSGKTTLLRMLSTLMPPTSGDATVAGYDIRRDPDAVRQCIGFVSPSHGLYNDMTPRQYLRYFALLNGVPKHEVDEIVADVIGWLSIQEYADKTCNWLSTGIRQRVAIGRAVVHQPPVLLFDEPTNNLDDASTEVILQFIRDCRREGQAVLFCTHIIPQVEDICDRVAIMVRGRIDAVGTVDELCSLSGMTCLEDAYRAVMQADIRERLEV